MYLSLVQNAYCHQVIVSIISFEMYVLPQTILLCFRIVHCIWCILICLRMKPKCESISTSLQLKRYVHLNAIKVSKSFSSDTYIGLLHGCENHYLKPILKWRNKRKTSKKSDYNASHLYISVEHGSNTYFWNAEIPRGSTLITIRYMFLHLK